MNLFLKPVSRTPSPRARVQARERIRLDGLPRGSQWLPRITALLSLLCCGLSWAASAPVIRERVGTGIQINDIRNLVIDESTQVFTDGVQAIGPVTRERVGTGARIRGVLGSDANGDLTAGTLAQIWIDYELLGLVTATDPLQIMGQTVIVNGDTVLEGVSDVALLALGDAVDASAYFDANGSAVASRLGKRPTAPARWRVSGFLTAYNGAGSSATVGTQPVSFNGVTPIGCAATPLAVGSFVELRANPIAGFVPGQVINTVTELRCAVAVPFGTIGSAGAVEAVVSAVGETSFSLGNLTVQYDGSTQFVQGGAGDISVGALLEAAGTFSSANVLQATRIFFIQPHVRIRAPVGPADVVIGESAMALGELFFANPQLRDDDGVYAGGLSAPRHVELRGYVDRNGEVFALRSRIRENTPQPTEIELSGPVGVINRPNFTVLGITVLTGAGTVYLDGTGAIIDAEAFFAGLLPGAPVETDLASYNATTRELLPTIVQLGDDPPPVILRAVEGGAGGVVQGTVTGFDPDALFINGFEN